jgi:Family of unknown function (DUF6717)
VKIVLRENTIVEQIFPINRPSGGNPDGVCAIQPYRHEGAWVFDDPTTGLVQEPFVAGITEMIDRLAAGIPEAEEGFRLVFSAQPFKGHQALLTWIRADPVEGNWYREEESGAEGWLCPALFCYFSAAPSKIYVRAEPKQASNV